MKQNSLFTKSIALLLCCFFVLSALLIPKDAYAIYEGVRKGYGDGYNKYEGGNCKTGAFEFDPLIDNKDLYWDTSNPVCVGFMVASGALVYSASMLSSSLCEATNVAALSSGAIVRERTVEAAISPESPTITPKTAFTAGYRGYRCVTRGAELTGLTASSNPGAAAAAIDAARCCSSTAAYIAAIGTAVGVLRVTYEIAKNVYSNAQICGHEWQSWEKDSDNVWMKTKGRYRKCVENLFLNNYSDLSDADCRDSLGVKNYPGKYETKDIKNIFFREFIYGGKEVTSSGAAKCNNPWTKDERKTYLGYKDSRQRYYMTGPGQPSVYACYRFLIKEVTEESKKAYDCCIENSQQTLCMDMGDRVDNENADNAFSDGDVGGAADDAVHDSLTTMAGDSSVFCKVGSRCSLNSVLFDVYESQETSSYICAKTYSVCPYNHLMGGGSEEQELVDLPDGGSGDAVVRNFCQYMKHCSKIPLKPYVRSVNFEGAFISAACKDLKGDSQNVFSYTAPLIPTNSRGFTAPLAQCFKETMENVFLNKAGDTECISATEDPDASGECASGYVYKKGVELNSPSFFITIQNGLQEIIKMGLVISVIMFGYGVLIGTPKEVINKKMIMVYILKIGLVMYFAVGDAWQSKFMEGVLGTSSFLAELTFQVDEEKDEEYLDGCQFPRFNYADTDELTKYDEDTRQYAYGNRYLRIWDTLDCKIAIALGFGPEVSVPNLVLMMLAGLVTAGVGALFFVAAFCFAFLMISVAIKALHVFLISTISVVILMYVSPITITMAMFEKTKGIFDGWWKNLLGFTLQPMILFAYLGMMITLFDATIVGDVKFEDNGVGNPKTIRCMDDVRDISIYCIFNAVDITTWKGLEPIGIGVPVLNLINQVKIESIIKAAIIMFIFMKFMDQISNLAKTLVVGDGDLSSDWGGADVMAKEAFKALAGIEERGAGIIRRLPPAVARAGYGGMKGVGRALNSGKSTVAAGAKAVSDRATSSKKKDKADSSSTTQTNKESSNSSIVKGEKTTSSVVNSNLNDTPSIHKK